MAGSRLRHGGIDRRFLRDSRPERIADRQAIAAPSILEVFAKEQRAVLELRGGDDQRVPPAQPMAALDVLRP